MISERLFVFHMALLYGTVDFCAFCINNLFDSLFDKLLLFKQVVSDCYTAISPPAVGEFG